MSELELRELQETLDNLREKNTLSTSSTVERPVTQGPGVLCFLGLPGTGKTVLITKLAREADAVVHHVGSFAAARGLADVGVAKRGELLHGIDQLFLNSITAPAIIDGFPRSAEQVSALEHHAKAQNWQLTAVVLTFPLGREIVTSFNRQRDRAVARLKSEPNTQSLNLELARAVLKIQRSIEADLAAVHQLRAAGHPFIDILAVRATNQLYRENRVTLLRALGREDLSP